MGVARLAEAQAAVLLRDLDAEGADLAQALDHVGRDLALPVDPVAVHPLTQEALEPLHERAGSLQLRRVHGGEGMDQVESERALEQLADEAGRLPFLFAGGFGDLPGLLFGREPGVPGLTVGMRTSVIARPR